MNLSAKEVARVLTPPLLWNAGKLLVRRPSPAEAPHQEGRERDAAWYDERAEDDAHYLLHYTQSPYYFLWSVVADRMLRGGVRSVLEVGCGPGQMASLLKDRGLRSYRGFDFSIRRVEQARKACSGFTFVHADARETDLFETFEHDAVLCQETLEHIEADLEVIARIRPGARFYGTVPSFPASSHVRHFESAEEVRDRYAGSFRSFSVEPFLSNAGGTTFYLMEAEK